MSFHIFIIVVANLLLAETSQNSARTWTDNSKEFSVEAALVDVKLDTVVLRKMDGAVITVPIARLSEADRKYVASLEKASVDNRRRETSGSRPKSLTDVIESVDGGVVLITTRDALKRKTGTGTGFVIDRKGLVITNFHVLARAVEAYVQFRDGRRIDVDGVRAFSAERDLAVLQLRESPDDLECFSIHQPIGLRQGDELIAIGHPSGFEFTVTTGIVSAVRKTEELPEAYHEFLDSADDTIWVQTSAAISSGSSGGPLMDKRGNLVAINTWVAEGQNLGFAVHASHLRELLKSELEDQLYPLPIPGLGLIIDPDVAAVADEFVREYQVVLQEAWAAESQEQAAELLTAKDPAPRYASRLLDLARTHSHEDTGFEALLYLCQISRGNSIKSNISLSEAIRRLTADYPDHERMNEVAIALAGVPRKNALELLRRVIERSPHHGVRGVACYCLATALINADQGSGRYGPDIIALLQRVESEYKEVRVGGWLLSEDVEDQLFAMKHLSIGRPAPDIVGKDLDGVAFSLNDYRGKVTVIDFWVDWCPYCREMYPLERRLVDDLKEAPFALLGVNCDERPAFEQLVERRVVTWRNWWDGPDGKISKRWQVATFPTLYVLDADGIIRFKNIRGARVEWTVERLLGEIRIGFPRDILPAKSIWKYLDNGSDQGTAWRGGEFNDAAWPSGGGPFGYGWGDETTVVRRTKSPTTYFRTTFEVVDISAVRDLLLETYYDDAVAVYVNGTEVIRSNLAADAGFDETAAGPCYYNGQRPQCFSLDPTLLVPGANVVAAEVHQEHPASADLQFDLAISANVLPAIHKALVGENAPARRAAAELLGRLPTVAPQFETELRQLLNEDDPDMQMRALLALMNVESTEESQLRLPKAMDETQAELRAALSLSLSYGGWTVAKTPGFSPQDYEQAIQAAKAARLLSPSSPKFAGTLAMSHFRLGQYEQALKTLPGGPFARFALFDAHPAELACRSMAECQLGRAEASQKTLKRLRDTLAKPEWATYQEGYDLMKEAESLIGTPEQE